MIRRAERKGGRALRVELCLRLSKSPARSGSTYSKCLESWRCVKNIALATQILAGVPCERVLAQLSGCSPQARIRQLASRSPIKLADIPGECSHLSDFS